MRERAREKPTKMLAKHRQRYQEEEMARKTTKTARKSQNGKQANAQKRKTPKADRDNKKNKRAKTRQKWGGVKGGGYSAIGSCERERKETTKQQNQPEICLQKKPSKLHSV